jgi:Putative zincin peptidase
MKIIDRYHPQLRREQQVAIDAGHVEKRDELALLEAEQLLPLARLSLLLLLVGGIFFAGLDLLIFVWQRHTLPTLTWGEGALWLGLNILGYIIILPIHEAIHGLAFAFWGGRPHFGTKLPLALYCGAKDQIFRRNQYLVVGLAPLIVITIACIVLTVFSPVLAAYTLLASAGNCSGAAGDVWVAVRLWRLPKHVLVEDTETGYRVWEVPKTEPIISAKS